MITKEQIEQLKVGEKLESNDDRIMALVRQVRREDREAGSKRMIGMYFDASNTLIIHRTR